MSKSFNLIAISIAFVVFASIFTSEFKASEDKIVFVDVGQGDATLFHLENGKNVLLDTGNGTKNADKQDSNIVKYLKSSQIKNIDILMISHYHYDHDGAISELIKEFNVGEIILPKTTDPDRTVDVLEDNGRKFRYITQGDTVAVDDNLVFDVVFHDADADEENDKSLIMKCTFNNDKILFTGDSSLANDNKLAIMYPNNELDVDVLKVSHHGSVYATSEKLLNAVTPENATISVGIDNKYGHPHREIVSRLNDNNINIYRTDQMGSIEYYTEGNIFKTTRQ